MPTHAVAQTAILLAAVFLPMVLLASSAFASNPNLSCQPLGVARVTTAVDDHQLTTLYGNVHRFAVAENDAGRVDDDMPLEHIILMLQRSPEQEAALNTRIDQMHNRHSPYFHQWLRPEEVGACYGPVNSDIAEVTGWLQMHGFHIDTVPAGRTMVIFTGTAGQVRTAFHTEIHNLYVNNERHIANMTEPQIPKALAPVIAGFRSLHNFFPKPLSHIVGPVQRDPKTGAYHPVQSASGEQVSKQGGAGSLLTFSYNSSTWWAVGPQDFYTIYNENALLKASTPINGAGQTVAIVQDSDVNPADVTTFRAEFGLPTYPATPSATQGGVNFMFGITAGNYCNDPGIVSGVETEGDIDVQWTGAVAPAATIDYVSCEDTSTTSGIDLSAPYIINSLASTVSAFSVSFGVCEAQLPESGPGSFGSNQYYVSLWQQAAAEGQTAIIAAGDSGDDGCDRGNGEGPDGHSIGTTGVSVSGVSTTPYNVATGGTDFSDNYQTGFSPTNYWTNNDSQPFESALSYIPETAWNNTCGNPLIADFYRAWEHDNATQEQTCNDISGYPFVHLDGGGGGISTISSLPTWQSVYGVGLSTNFTSTSMRNVPDISMFASDGGLWQHFLMLCESDQATCDYTNGADAIALAAGGSSFVAPMFNGIMALVNQATSTSSVPARQGQADYTLYALATAEYGTASTQNVSTTAPSSYTCEASNINALSTYKTIFPSCTFQEINRTSAVGSSTCLAGTSTACLTDNNAQPCAAGSPDCYTWSSSDQIGLLSSSTSTEELAYVQSFGYNDATGLGSLNIANLVNNWNTGVTTKFPSTTTSSASPSSIYTTQTTTLTATVTATGRGSLAPPMGTVTFYPGSACTGTALGTANLVPSTTSPCGKTGCSTTTLANVAGSAIGASNTSIAACFSGDAANDAPSTGTASITVTQPALTLAAQSSSVTITAGQSGQVSLNLSANISVPASGVTLKCAGIPSDASCTFSALSGTIGTTATVVTMTIQTTTSDAKLVRPGLRMAPIFALIMPAMLLLPAAAGSRKRKSWLLSLTAMALILMLSWTGCGGGSSSSSSSTTTTPTSQNYSVTATASGTGLTSGTTGTITVTVTSQ